MNLSNLLSAINAVMSEVGYVQKAQRNAFHGYRYAGEGDLLEVLRPAMIKHGLVLIPSFDGEAPQIDQHGNTHLVMSYKLAHKSGEVWPEPLRMPGCGGDKNSKGGVGDKGTYKAITGANKYLLFKLFQIETGDDPEKDETAPTPATQPRTAPPSARGVSSSVAVPSLTGEPLPDDSAAAVADLSGGQSNERLEITLKVINSAVAKGNSAKLAQIDKEFRERGAESFSEADQATIRAMLDEGMRRVRDAA